MRQPRRLLRRSPTETSTKPILLSPDTPRLGQGRAPWKRQICPALASVTDRAAIGIVALRTDFDLPSGCLCGFVVAHERHVQTRCDDELRPRHLPLAEEARA